MIKIKTFEFNDLHVNTYLLYDETGDCVIIDPGCADANEENKLSDFIASNNLHPVKILNTHAHFDHIAGNKYVSVKYNIGLEIHKASFALAASASDSAVTYGFNEIDSVEPSAYLEDGDQVKFGNSSLKVLYTPGHAAGSICFYSEPDKFIVVGDVLFYGSIGRTDFPTGNFDLLMDSIRNKLFELPEDTVVYPGHGPKTSIGFEEETNIYIM